MKTSDFDYPLPEELIAYEPLAQRSASRLLCLNPETGARAHKHFTDITQMLRAGDMLIFNNSKVIPARLSGVRETGGKVDILIERVIDNGSCAIAHVKTGNTMRKGARFSLSDGTPCEVLGRDEKMLFILGFVDGHLTKDGWHGVMKRIGDIPLPPYIERDTKPADSARYQTVYADEGKAASAAAPTAGLHFDEPLLQNLQDQGVQTGFVTLHVGAGTFQPLRTGDEDDPRAHVMHSEYIEIEADLCKRVNATKTRGGRIIAVGTTSVRSLESAWSFERNQLEPFTGETDIFIAPGYKFGCVDELITNFHFPRTTLLMLVAALTGRDAMMETYMEAIENKYRFFSYGDAMYIGKGYM